MGITESIAKFSGDPPTLKEIVAAMSRLCGLAVRVEDSPAKIKADLWELKAKVWFQCAPHERVELYSYQAGANARWHSHMLEVMSGMDRATLERLKPPPPTDAHQAVTVRGYISEEGTLSDVTALALESLGGTLTHPMSDERRHRASTRLTPAGLAARHRHNNRAWLRALAAAPFQLARALVRSAIGRLRRLF